MKKKVLVTGGSRGIGRAIAEYFLNKDYELFGTFFNSEEKARELESKYGEDCVHLFGPYDFRNTTEIFGALKKFQNYLFDTVVCSAGIFLDGDDFNEFDLERFIQTMNCNFYQSLILTTGLKDNIVEGGSIVLMSSNDAYPGAFASIAYTVSKAAIISLTKCLSMNFGEKNVRVNSVAPGAIDTDMNTSEQAEMAPYFSPTSRMGTADEVAKVVYFLASDNASFVNGANLTIDGGYCNTSILLKAEADSALSKDIRNFIRENK